jgi:mannopine transport system permease protein
MRGTPGTRIFSGIYLGACLVILVFLVLPTLIVIPMSFGTAEHLEFPPSGFSLRWYQTYFTDPSWGAATWFSVKIGLLTTLAATIIGNMAAIALVRGRVPFREVFHSLMLAPLIVPNIVVAISVYLQFAPLNLAGTTLGFVLIHTALAVPYVVLIVSAALQRIDPALEMAALSLGAPRWRAYTEVTIPLVLPAVAASAVFAFLASFDETVVAFFLSGADNKTITRKIFEEIDYSLSPVIAAVSTIFIAATVSLMVFATVARHRTGLEAHTTLAH